jgi:hypothetical protein
MQAKDQAKRKHGGSTTNSSKKRDVNKQSFTIHNSFKHATQTRVNKQGEKQKNA